MNQDTHYTPEMIKELRKSLGFTQEAMADRLQVSFTSINRWENGQTKPSKLATFHKSADTTISMPPNCALSGNLFIF